MVPKTNIQGTEIAWTLMDAKDSDGMSIAEQSATAEALIRDMTRLQDSRCPGCSAGLCSHQVLMNIVLGFKDSPRCLNCLASALDHDAQPFRDHLIDYLHQRECHRTAWEWADRNEGVAGRSLPRCLAVSPIRSSRNGTAVDHSPQGSNAVAVEWDAGDMGCGDLVLELRLRLHAMAPGQIIKLSARDPGAPEDLPAWCRLTGHILLRAEHPSYWIKRKE